MWKRKRLTHTPTLWGDKQVEQKKGQDFIPIVIYFVFTNQSYSLWCPVNYFEFLSQYIVY